MTEINLENSRIINNETLEQRFLSLPTWEKWLNSILDDGGIYYEAEDINGYKSSAFAEFISGYHTDIDSNVVYDDYVKFCGKVKSKTVRTKQELSRVIKKVIPDIKSMPRSVENGKKITPWRIPPLNECREKWEDHYVFNFNWTDLDTSRQMEKNSSVQRKVLPIKG